MGQSKITLYKPRFADLFFGLAGVGSTTLLIFGSSRPVQQAASSAPSVSLGLALAGAVIAIAMLSCFAHKIDRRGWDQYMFQIMAQSAYIGMISFLIAGVALDFLLSPWLGLPQSQQMVLGKLPIAVTSWAIGYFYLRVTGTEA